MSPRGFGLPLGDDGQCEEGLCDRTLWWSSGSEGSKASAESATTSKCYWQNILKLGKGDDASSHPATAREGTLMSGKRPVYARIPHQRRVLEDSYTADEEHA